MTQSDSAENLTTESVKASAPRDLTLAGVVVLLFACLTAGVVISAGFRLIEGIATSGWHWKGNGATKTAIDLSPGDKSDREELFTFKKVDLQDLEDSIHVTNATQAILKMDYGRSLSELKLVSPARQKADPSWTALEVECLLSLKQSEKVIAIADAAIERRSTDYTGWLWRAEAYEQLKQYEKAISDYKQAFAMLPNMRKVLQKTLSKQLIDSMERAIACGLHRRLGACYEREGDYKQAALEYQKSIMTQVRTLAPTLQLKPERAAVSTAQKNVQELTEAIAASPDDGALYLMRAKAYKLQGKFDLALRDYERVGKREAANLFYERAGAYFALGKFKNAAHDLRKCHAEDPLYEMPHMRQKKYSTAVFPASGMKRSRLLSRFDKEIQDNPNEPESYFHRGVLQMAFREYDAGAADLLQFLQLKGATRSVPVVKANVDVALCRGLSRRKNEYDSALSKAAAVCDSKWWQSIISYMNDGEVTESMLLEASKNSKARAVQAHYYIGQYLVMKGLKTKAADHFRQGIALAAPVDEYYLCKLALLPEPGQPIE